MVEKRPFKTKLCALYQRGRCDRQTCTFAHGGSELRGFSEDRQNSKDIDLRTKLDRRRSPLSGYSRGRDARGWHGRQRFSPPRSFKRRTLDPMDGQGEPSGSLRNSEGSEGWGKGKKLTSSDSTNLLEEELKQVQDEVDVLIYQRNQLEIELEETTQEADSLSSKIRDLEAQLSEEKDKSGRANSKIKMLIGAHAHHTLLQDKLKRSQVQLEVLVQDLGEDVTQLVAVEDSTNINIISDEEIPKLKRGYTSPKKQLHSSVKDPEGSNSAYITKGNSVKFEGRSQRISHGRFTSDKEAEVGNKRKGTAELLSNKGKSKQWKDVSKGFTSSDKLKVLESNAVVPPTSMAAHALDDFVEQIEVEGNTEAGATPHGMENGLSLPLPPLPKVSRNHYSEYEGDNETVDVDVDVDVDGLQEDLEEVDIV